MQLVCEKHNESMESENAYCHHPDDYCKFRQRCMIHFIGGENKKAWNNKEDDAEQKSGKV